MRLELELDELLGMPLTGGNRVNPAGAGEQGRVEADMQEARDSP